MVRRQAGIQYRTATVGHGDISVAISATGNPNAVVTVQVGSQVSGIILAFFADFNTKVTKGQLIAQIDPAPFQAKVDQAQANLDAARAAVANTQAVVQQALAGIQAAKSVLAARERVLDPSPWLWMGHFAAPLFPGRTTLISVRERTREIGLWQAFGAKTCDILTQFLVEPVTSPIHT